jgi:hypothetical protein
MKAIKDIEGLVSSNMGVIKALFSLMKLEARLAGLSLANILLTLMLLFVVILTAWECLFLLIGFALFQVFNSALIATAITLTLNLILLVGLIRYVMVNLKHASFEKTRKFFSQFTQDNKDYEFEKGANGSHREDGTAS